MTIDPTRVMPAVPGAGGDDPAAATVPRLRSVTPAGGGALGDGRVLVAASALGALGSFAGWLLAARTLPPDRLGAAVAVVAVVAVAGCVARPDRGAALVPRLSAAGRRAGRVVVRSLATAVALGAGMGAVLAVLVPGPAATLTGLLSGPAAGVPWPGVLLVAAATAAWAAGAVFDGVVVALDRPWWATTHVAVLVTGRIALIAAAGVLVGAAPDVAASDGFGEDGWPPPGWRRCCCGRCRVPRPSPCSPAATAAGSRPPPRRRCSGRWPWRGSGRRCCTRWRRCWSSWVWGPARAWCSSSPGRWSPPSTSPRCGCSAGRAARAGAGCC